MYTECSVFNMSYLPKKDMRAIALSLNTTKEKISPMLKKNEYTAELIQNPQIPKQKNWICTPYTHPEVAMKQNKSKIRKKSFFKDLFIYFKVRVAQREVEKREGSSIHWFSPQLAAMARVVPIQSQEQGASSRSPTWVQGPRTWAIFYCFPRLQQRSGSI